MTQKGGDHDLLIRIETLLRGLTDRVNDHLKAYERQMALMEKKLDAAHRRIDWVTIGGLVSILTLLVAIATLFLKGV